MVNALKQEGNGTYFFHLLDEADALSFKYTIGSVRGNFSKERFEETPSVIEVFETIPKSEVRILGNFSWSKVERKL